MNADKPDSAEKIVGSTNELERILIDFDDFLNEPPPYENEMRVREYRHAAYKKWQLVQAEVNRLMRSNAPLTGATTGGKDEHR